jgi:pimeloyl-ACP methyl ester carboxylesterase
VNKIGVCIKSVFISAFILSTLLVSSASAESKFCFQAEMLGGSSEVCADVYENPNAVRLGKTILGVHGFTEAAKSWAPLVQAMFNDKVQKRTVKRFIALDLPGRGNSPMPVGLPGGVYGDLYDEDFIDVIIQTIDALKRAGIGPQVLMGHSMGGLAVQGVQEELLSRGSSLAARGVFQAVLLGALPANGAVWHQIPFPDFVLWLFMQGEPDGPYGQYIFFPPPAAQTGPGFTTLSGELAENTPPVEEIVVGTEPINCTMQVNATPDYPARPYAREHAFSIEKGTLLMVVAFSQDAFVIPDDEQALYNYLTGYPTNYFYRYIDTPQAVHNMYITEPDKVAEVLRLIAP